MDDATSTDVSSWSRGAALDALEALQCVKASTEAREQRLLARIDALDRAEHPGVQWDRESVSSILRCAPVTAHGKLAQASALVRDFPHTLAALEAGRITAGHTRVLLDSAASVDVRVLAKFEHRVLRRAETTSVSEFRARCRRAALAVDPQGAQRRHELLERERHVEIRHGLDGMTDIRASVATDAAARVRQHLDSCTDTVDRSDPDDDRTRDAVRADVFVELLTGTAGGAVARGDRSIQVSVAMSALLELDELPGEIDGEPVAASLARHLAHDPRAWWRPVLIDRDGHLEAIGARRYRPGAMLRRTIELHDRVCQFPGCRRRAVCCELDHVVPFDHDDPSVGGLTEVENLHVLCKRHHRLKHEGGWSVIRKDGVSTWRSPHGRRYEKSVEPYLDPVDPWSDGPGPPPDDPPPN